MARLDGATDPGTAEEIRGLLREASPRHGTDPADGDVHGWVGVRDGAGRLVAVGAHLERVPGVPYLASIATLPSRRGEGLGTAVTAALTRDRLRAGAATVVLELYADNDVALRLYRRLGFLRHRRLSAWDRTPTRDRTPARDRLSVDRPIGHAPRPGPESSPS